MMEFFVIFEVTLSLIAVIILIIYETPLNDIVDKVIYKFKMKRQDRLFHKYCEKCRDYNCIDLIKMTTCQGCRYGDCYPKKNDNYFRERR